MRRNRILLRRYRPSHGGGVLAVIVDGEANPGNVVCYEHIGQHGEGDYQTILRITRPCDPMDADAQALVRELRSIGYDPELSARITRH